MEANRQATVREHPPRRLLRWRNDTAVPAYELDDDADPAATEQSDETPTPSHNQRRRAIGIDQPATTYHPLSVDLRVANMTVSIQRPSGSFSEDELHLVSRPPFSLTSEVKKTYIHSDYGANAKRLSTLQPEIAYTFGTANDNAVQ